MVNTICRDQFEGRVDIFCGGHGTLCVLRDPSNRRAVGNPECVFVAREQLLPAKSSICCPTQPILRLAVLRA